MDYWERTGRKNTQCEARETVPPSETFDFKKVQNTFGILGYRFFQKN